MDLADPRVLKKLLQERNIKPNKVLGQHFLVSQNTLQKIIAAADLKRTDTVLEVGPGLGVLTQALAERAGRVVAVEKDKNLIPVLTELFHGVSNVEIVQGDILKFDPAHYNLGGSGPSHLDAVQGDREKRSKPYSSSTASSIEAVNEEMRQIRGSGYKIVADIPYYLTSRFLRTFLESSYQPTCMVLLVQKELADRVSAAPPHASLLSNAVQYYAHAVRVASVSRSAFFPPPKVDSAVLKLDIVRRYAEKKDKIFFQLLKKAFASPRKQIFPVLAKAYPKNDVENLLNLAKISQKSRPQEVYLEQWIKVSELLT